MLALGLPMLVALMGLLDVDWNFANFFGLPILIGAGHEYGVFMVHRYREALLDPRRAWRRWDVSDRALPPVRRTSPAAASASSGSSPTTAASRAWGW